MATEADDNLTAAKMQGKLGRLMPMKNFFKKEDKKKSAPQKKEKRGGEQITETEPAAAAADDIQDLPDLDTAVPRSHSSDEDNISLFYDNNVDGVTPGYCLATNIKRDNQSDSSSSGSEDKDVREDFRRETGKQGRRNKQIGGGADDVDGGLLSVSRLSDSGHKAPKYGPHSLLGVGRPGSSGSHQAANVSTDKPARPQYQSAQSITQTPPLLTHTDHKDLSHRLRTPSSIHAPEHIAKLIKPGKQDTELGHRTEHIANPIKTLQQETEVIHKERDILIEKKQVVIKPKVAFKSKRVVSGGAGSEVSAEERVPQKTARMTIDDKTCANAFRTFSQATQFRDILNHFRYLCQLLNLDPLQDQRKIYSTLREHIQTNEGRTLWRNLDKRAGQAEYVEGQVCMGSKVLVIGAGPCGLRMAVECALLGAHVVVVEARDYNSRNNVLHLWPSVIHDIKTIGAKVFYPKFCGGNREHVSIQRFQAMLLKLALVVGVEVHAPVCFESIQEPRQDQSGTKRGWHVKVSPSNHQVETYDFDMIVGADGRRNSLKVFKRKVFRGKLAIGITANFVNLNTAQDKAIEEIGGLFYVYSPEFFDNLKEKAGINLENFVYFKDDTHYFVMTARKESLLKKGVLKMDFPDTKHLLSKENVDHSLLLAYSREAADISTDNALNHCEFARTHTGEEDVAIFDFTALQQAENSCMAVEKEGHKLLLSIVGDTLIEPFWPTGSGVARGFLSVFDAAWLARSWFLGEKSPLEVLAERESVYSVLSQTKPDNLSRNLTLNTIEPKTRYGPMLKFRRIKPDEVRHLYVTSGLMSPASQDQPIIKPERPSLKRKRLEGESMKMSLLRWYQGQLEAFRDVVTVRDLATSWRNGLALCALLTKHRPDLIDVRKLNQGDVLENNKKAFLLIQREYGISPVLSPDDLLKSRSPDTLALLSYLTCLKQCIEHETGSTKVPKDTDSKRRRKVKRRVSATGMLIRTSKRQRKIEMQNSLKRQNTPYGNKSGTLERCQVAGLAKMRIKALEQADSKPQPVTRKRMDLVPATTSGEVCCVCGQSLYIVERQTAHGYFFHRDCFKCADCHAPLWISTSSACKDNSGKVLFYCQRHTEESLKEDSIDNATSWMTNNTSPNHKEESPSQEPDEPMEVTEMMGMMSMAGAPVPQGMMGMGLLDAAVGEEEVDDEEAEEQSDGLSIVSEEMGAGDTGTLGRRTKRTLYSLATSVRFMVAHEIQQELEESHTQECELEQVGSKMEHFLRQQKLGSGEQQEELMEEWLDVIEEKQQLQQRQHSLMLKAKLLELQERHSRLQAQINYMQYAVDNPDDSMAMQMINKLTQNMPPVTMATDPRERSVSAPMTVQPASGQPTPRKFSAPNNGASPTTGPPSLRKMDVPNNTSSQTSHTNQAVTHAFSPISLTQSARPPSTGPDNLTAGQFGMKPESPVEPYNASITVQDAEEELGDIEKLAREIQWYFNTPGETMV